MILGAAYMLYLYRRVIFGRLTKDDLRTILDLSPREIAVFAPLVVLTLWMGVYPVQLHQLLRCLGGGDGAASRPGDGRRAGWRLRSHGATLASVRAGTRCRRPDEPACPH